MLRKAQGILFSPSSDLPSSPFPGMECSPSSQPSLLTLVPSRRIPLEIFVRVFRSSLNYSLSSDVPALYSCGLGLVSFVECIMFPFFVASKLLYELLYDLFIYYFWWIYLSLLDNQFHVAKYFNVCSFMCFKCLIQGMWSVKFFWIN